MISILEHIEYLTLNYDCVIIPDFGAIIAHYESAKFNDDGTIIPPSRTIGFNQSINHSDGLLINSVSRKCNISFDDATNVVQENVKCLKLQLHEDGEYALGNLGIFHSGEDGELVFNPFNKGLFQSDFYGLSSFKMPLLSCLKEMQDVDNDTTNNVSIKKLRLDKFRKATRYAASIALLLIMTLVLTTPISIDKSKGDFASMNLIKESSESSELSIKPETLIIQTPKVEITENKEDVKIDTDAAIQEDSKQEHAIVMNDNLEIKESAVKDDNSVNSKYYLVVASLVSKDLAEDYMADKNDSTLSLVEMDGKFRVCCASSSKYSELSRIKSAINSKYPGTWICRK